MCANRDPVLKIWGTTVRFLPSSPHPPVQRLARLFVLGAMPGLSDVEAYSHEAIPDIDIVRVHGRYRVGKPLGSGSFGTFIKGSSYMIFSFV